MKPNPDTLTAPTAPIVGKATELQSVPAVTDRMASTLESMLNPANPDLDPDLKVVFGALGGGELPRVTANPLGLGRELAQGLARRNVRPLSIDVNPATQQALPTGTVTLHAAGTVTESKEPTTGYVMIDERAGTTLTVNWKVNGAGTVWVDHVQGSGPYATNVRQEVPTHASATFSKGNRKLAAAQLRMTPGNCLNVAGPEALTLSGWAGREQDAPAALNLGYAWTNSGITLKASALYRTVNHTAQAEVNLDVRGTTANRCTPAALAFTPTRADLTASVKVPGDEVQASLRLRKLSNLVISDTELRAKTPFAQVKGDLSASVQHNGQPMLTAFGPLADGGDLNLLPGDQVVVRYVDQGKLVETSLPDALEKLSR